MKKFIVIEGNIGAGKTTLAKKIAHQFNTKLILEEFEENPFLSKFYEKPERYALPLELSFLTDRYLQLQKELRKQNSCDSVLVSDYHFLKSLLFAGHTLEGNEYDLYTKLFNIIYPSFPKPDLYVYIHRRTETLLSNIKKRGREYEQQITKSYLKSVEESYFGYFDKHKESDKFLVINSEDLDFVENETDYKKIVKLIFEQEYEAGVNLRFFE